MWFELFERNLFVIKVHLFSQKNACIKYKNYFCTEILSKYFKFLSTSDEVRCSYFTTIYPAYSNSWVWSMTPRYVEYSSTLPLLVYTTAKNEETHYSMEDLLSALKYHDHDWLICWGSKSYWTLPELQISYRKYPCFVWMDTSCISLQSTLLECYTGIQQI